MGLTYGEKKARPSGRAASRSAPVGWALAYPRMRVSPRPVWPWWWCAWWWTPTIDMWRNL